MLGRLPKCFGTYAEAETVCDGDPTAGDDVARAPCAMRPECTRFTRKLAEHAADRMGFIAYDVAASGKVVSAHVIDNVAMAKLLAEMEEMTGPVPPPPGAEEVERYIGPKRHYPWSSKYPGLRDLVEHWHRMLRRQLPWVAINNPPEQVMPGQIVVADLGKTAGHLTYRFKRGLKLNTYTVFARVLFRPQLQALHVLLPLKAAQIAELTGTHTMEVLQPRAYTWSSNWAHPKLPAMCRGLTKEGLALAAEVIGLGVKKGIINFNLEVNHGYADSDLGG